MDIEFAEIPRPDEELRDDILRRYTRLGALTRLGAWIAACRGQRHPDPLRRPRVVTFVAEPPEHDVSSSYPVTTPADRSTRAHLGLPQAGDYSLYTLAAEAGAGVRVVDLGVDPPGSTDPGTEQRIVTDSPGAGSPDAGSPGAGSPDAEDALGTSGSATDERTIERTVTAVHTGMAIADAEIDAGSDLLIPAESTDASLVSAVTVIAARTKAEPVEVTGQGPGVEDTTWMHRTAAVRDALWRTRSVRAQPLALLATVGGTDLAAITGFLVQAASRRTPVLLDGLCVSASALLAEELAPGCRAWFTAAHRSTEPAHALALDQLTMEAVVDLGLAEGGGLGALAILPLVSTAIQLTGS